MGKKHFPAAYHYPGHYPEPEALSYRMWAWEFLRRNRKYQLLCDKIGYEYFHNLRMDFFDTVSISGNDYNLLVDDQDRENEAIHLLSQYRKHSFLKSIEANSVHRENTGLEWHDTFGVKLPDHYFMNFPITLFSLEFAPPNKKLSRPDPNKPVTMSNHTGIEIDYKKNQAAITIDLAELLEPQINTIQEELRKIPGLLAENKRFLASNRKKEAYPHYIRILDAMWYSDTGKVWEFPPMQLATEFYPDADNNTADTEYPISKKIKNDRRAAKKLRDGGYISLPTFK